MDFSKIVRPLLRWYAGHARTLPWRDDPTPYRVWVSEIMLQQTRTETVIPYFERFVREIPDVRALAAAPEERLLKLWEGLGDYSRVRNLHRAAAVVVEEYGGALPHGAAQLRKLPGVGEYTAGAISSIAYGLPEPAVDGNVLRVAARLAASRENTADPACRRRVREVLRGVYPKDAASAFTQSLMELGATVCLPNGAPLCDRCPLAALCEGRRTGQAGALPVRSPRPKRKVQRRTVFLLLCGRRAAVRRRPQTGLLAGLWEFPSVAGTLPAARAEKVLGQWGVAPVSVRPLPKARHIFTHVEWKMAGYVAQVRVPVADFSWIQPETLLEKYAIPSAFRTYLQFLGKTFGLGTDRGRL